MNYDRGSELYPGGVSSREVAYFYSIPLTFNSVSGLYPTRGYVVLWFQVGK